jgi:hypothetical protein
MAAIDPRKPPFIADVQKHLATVGANNWKAVLDAHPDVPEATKWRWIREAKAADVPRPELINSRAKLVQKVKKMRPDARTEEARENGTERITKQLPAAPRPEYIARTGEAGLQTLDFVSEIHALYADASKLRAYAMKTRTDPETGEVTEVINNPAAFDKSIVRRASLLESAIKAVQEVWDLRTMQNFYETIIDEIGRESPECQRRIMERLAELNSRQGMTMSMRL